MAVSKLVGKTEFKDNLAEQIWLIRLRFTEDIRFVPGQYVSVKVSDKGERRSYSVASLPSDGEKRDYVDMLVDVSPGGVGSRYFEDLSVGDDVEVMGFLGTFVVDETLLGDEKKIVFVATGTGIAPERPMIEDLLRNKNYKGKVILVWGMRHENDLYWVDEFERLAKDHDNFEFDLIMSQPKEDWLGKKGHVEDVVKEMGADGERTAVFLCGAPGMIEEVKQIFMDKGVAENNIYYEKYF